MGPTVKKSADRLARWSGEIIKLVVKLAEGDSCLHHGRQYLVICPECKTVTCSVCSGELCHCDNDE